MSRYLTQLRLTTALRSRSYSSQKNQPGLQEVKKPSITNWFSGAELLLVPGPPANSKAG